MGQTFGGFGLPGRIRVLCPMKRCWNSQSALPGRSRHHVNIELAGEFARSSFIDGQQRMTTLLLLLGTAQLVVEEVGLADDLEAFPNWF